MAKTPEKKHNEKSVIICTVTKDIDTSRLNSYTCPHSFTPLASNRKCHSDAVEITLKKLASFSSIRLRCVVMERNRKGHPYCDVTTIRQTRYFRSDDVRFQDGDAVYIGKLGRGDAFFRLLLLSFNVCPCTGSCCHHVHAQGYIFIMEQQPERH